MSLCFGTSFGEFLFIEPLSISMRKCLALNQLKMIPKNVKNHSNCASGITSGFSCFFENINKPFIFSKDWSKQLMKKRIQLEII